MNRDRYFDMRRGPQQRPAAAALTYDPVSKESAPEIVAVGRGHVADQIIKLAAANGIPVHKDKGLVEALARLDVGTSIPRELYVVVAEVLAWVYRVDAERDFAEPDGAARPKA